MSVVYSYVIIIKNSKDSLLIRNMPKSNQIHTAKGGEHDAPRPYTASNPLCTIFIILTPIFLLTYKL